MSECNRPMKSFNVGGLSVALWENERDDSDGKRKSVSVRKTFWNRETKDFCEKSLSLNLSEVSCLANLLNKMQEAVIEERTDEVPF